MPERLRTPATSRGDAEPQHGRLPPAGHGGLAEAVLALQRSAGNRAVSRAVQAARRPPTYGTRRLQRLNREEVKDSFDYSGAPNLAAVTDVVLDKIVALTTEWETRAPTTHVKRPHFEMRDALDNLFQGEAYFYKELPSPDDPEYWAAVVKELIGGLDVRFGLAPAPPKPAQDPLVAPAREFIPLAQRWLIECAMGQGVVANLGRYSLRSGKFSSCSPVVMFNETTLQAGLFHYGANQPSQQPQLKEMHDRVKPTTVSLNWRLRYDEKTNAPVRTDADVDALTSFLGKLKPAAKINVVNEQGNQYYAYLDDRRQLQVTGNPPPSAGPFDATNIRKAGSLNAEVNLLVNESVYSPDFATGKY